MTGLSGGVQTTRVLSTPEETRKFGTELAAVLRPGDLVVLAGPLGAGKTVLAQGIGDGLAVTGPVTSPTFVIARVHRGPVPMVHVDAYRLDSLAEVDDLDLDAAAEESVTVVEWGEGLVEHIADAHLLVRITPAGDDTRAVDLVAVGADWAERLRALTAV